jgi:hypothetical protein
MSPLGGVRRAAARPCVLRAPLRAALAPTPRAALPGPRPSPPRARRGRPETKPSRLPAAPPRPPPNGAGPCATSLTPGARESSAAAARPGACRPDRLHSPPPRRFVATSIAPCIALHHGGPPRAPPRPPPPAAPAASGPHGPSLAPASRLDRIMGLISVALAALLLAAAAVRAGANDGGGGGWTHGRATF